MYKYLKYKEGKIIIKKTYFPKLNVFAGLCVNIPYDIQIHSAKNKITKISMKKCQTSFAERPIHQQIQSL